jgi:hypothetical protein
MIIINRGSVNFGRNSNIVASSGLSASAGGPFTVGYTSIGATTNVYLFQAGVACKFTPDVSGTVTGGYTYLIDNDYPGVPGVNTAAMALFSNSSTIPLNLLGYSSTQESPIGSYSWVNFPSFTQNVAGGLNLTSGVPIWIAVWTNTPGIIRGASDAGSTGQFSENSNDEIYPTWNVWDSVALNDAKLSIYLEVNP